MNELWLLISMNDVEKIKEIIFQDKPIISLDERNKIKRILDKLQLSPDASTIDEIFETIVLGEKEKLKVKFNDDLGAIK